MIVVLTGNSTKADKTGEELHGQSCAGNSSKLHDVGLMQYAPSHPSLTIHAALPRMMAAWSLHLGGSDRISQETTCFSRPGEHRA